MGNRIVRVGSVLGLCVLAVPSIGCLRSHGRDEPANPGGSAATDGDAGDGDAGGRQARDSSAPTCDTFLVGIGNLDSVDLLFVIDDSESMREEQPALRSQLERLVTALTTGDLDHDGMQDQPAVHDLHLGVVSADLGAGSLDGVPGCSALGDDAVLQHAGDPTVPGCASSFPSFLRYVDGEVDPNQVAADLGCIATLGIAGCSIEQPLGAALRALSPATNSGFAGRTGRQSALGIVIVSDEDDCSVEDPDTFAADSDPSEPPTPNLRCLDRPDGLFDAARYTSTLMQLRPGNAQLLFFGAIVGVPPDLIQPVASGGDDVDATVGRDAHYQAILDDPRMQQVVDPESTLEGGGALTPSCVVGSFAGEIERRAYPPRRIVEVVRNFGAQGSLASICDQDFTGVLEPLLDAVGHRVQSVCLRAPLFRDARGLVPGCEARWLLPAPSEGGLAPTHCSERPWLELVGASDAGGEICRVKQLALMDGQIAAGTGWFFDHSGGPGCPDGTASAVFTAEAAPPTGVTVEIECCD